MLTISFDFGIQKHYFTFFFVYFFPDYIVQVKVESDLVDDLSSQSKGLNNNLIFSSPGT